VWGALSPLNNPARPNRQMPRPAEARPAGGVIDEDEYAPGAFPASSSPSCSSSDGGGARAASAGSGAGAPEPWSARFPELRAAIDAAIAGLGGAVAPKLNWSSPTDALWVSGANSLRCASADEVILLLKSSDRAVFDLELLQRIRAAGAAAGGGAAAAPLLVLRRWVELRPEREFRCFVHDHAPAGICQRDPTQFFPQLQGAGEQARIREAVCGFQRQRFGRRFSRGSCEPGAMPQAGLEAGAARAGMRARAAARQGALLAEGRRWPGGLAAAARCSPC
jgi:hypothetical protein